jgi:hypothetical protein
VVAVLDKGAILESILEPLVTDNPYISSQRRLQEIAGGYSHQPKKMFSKQTKTQANAYNFHKA